MRTVVRLLPLVLCLVGIALLAVAVAPRDPDLVVEFTAEEVERILRHSDLPPAPADPTNAVADLPPARDFGRALFVHEGLSPSGEFSCVTCHDPRRGFSNGKRFGEAAGRSPRHASSLWNVAYKRWFNWDGSADTLWGQGVRPFELDHELAGSRVHVVRAIAADPRLRRAYERLFGRLPEGLDDAARFPPDARPMPEQPDHPRHRAWLRMSESDRELVNSILINAMKAIAAFQRSLIAHDAPFDRFAAGLRDGDPLALRALTPAAQRGLKLFVTEAVHCRTCHSGPNFSDGEFHNLGLPPVDGGRPRDPGRYEGIRLAQASTWRGSGSWSDAPDHPAARTVDRLLRSPETWGQFKTPSLRNVALSPPYMHQGHFADLEAVVEFYSTLEGRIAGHHEDPILVPLQLGDAQINDLIAFLESLTDEDDRARHDAGPESAPDPG